MSQNKELVREYYESLGRLDREALSTLLAPDVVRVEWADGFPTSGVPICGKDAVLKSISDPPGSGGLQIKVLRLTEENNVVVGEADIGVPLKEGPLLMIRALNIFELEVGKVRKVTSYTVEIEGPG